MSSLGLRLDQSFSLDGWGAGAGAGAGVPAWRSPVLIAEAWLRSTLRLTRAGG